MTELKQKIIEESIRKSKHYLDNLKSIMEDLHYQTEKKEILNDIVSEMDDHRRIISKKLTTLEFHTQ